MLDLRTYRQSLTRLGAGGIAIWLVFVNAHARAGVQWLGLVLTAIGLAGVIVAQWTLGRSFSITPQARQLVTRGIYSKLRNPIYVFGTIFMAGLILIIQKPWLWVVLIALVVVQVIRARKEARVLEEKFGEEYRRYRGKTWL